MHLTKILRRSPFPPGFYVITGAQGAGKTSLAAALLCTDHKRWAKYRSDMAREVASEYYRQNGVKLNISSRLYFTNIKILLDKRRRLLTHYVDLPRLGLPNPDYDVQYLPKGSVVFIQEADLLLFCRTWAETNVYLINLLKYIRHNMLTVFFDCQDINNLEAAVRRLTMGIFHVNESYTTSHWLFWKKRKWRYTYVNNQLNNLMKTVANGVEKRVSVVRNGRFRFIGNIFERYKSFSGIWYFLNGIEKKGYEYLPHPAESFSISDIKKWVEAHPLIKPASMRRGYKKQEAKNDNKVRRAGNDGSKSIQVSAGQVREEQSKTSSV